MNHISSKRQTLIKLSNVFDETGFEYLRSMYVNILPYSIKIDSPLQLFQFLDIGDSINLEELYNNLFSIGYSRIIVFFKEYIELNYRAKSRLQDKSITFLLNILREGLRKLDISNIIYLFGYSSQNSSFELFIILLYFEIAGDYAEIIFLSNKLFPLFKINSISKKNEFKYVTTFDDILESEFYFFQDKEKHKLLYRIAKSIDSEDTFNAVKFLFDLPIYKQDLKSPLSLFNYLEFENKLDLDALSSVLYTINNKRLAKIVDDYITFNSKPNSVKVNKPSKEKVIFITNFMRLLTSDYELNRNDFFSITNDLLQRLNPSYISLDPLIQTLLLIDRYDLAKLSTKVSGVSISIPIPEGSFFTKDEVKLFRLKFKIDVHDMDKLCKLYKIDKMFDYPGEFLMHLVNNNMTNLSEMRNNLRYIHNEELIKCIDGVFDE